MLFIKIFPNVWLLVSDILCLMTVRTYNWDILFSLYLMLRLKTTFGTSCVHLIYRGTVSFVQCTLFIQYNFCWLYYTVQCCSFVCMASKSKVIEMEFPLNFFVLNIVMYLLYIIPYLVTNSLNNPATGTWIGY